MRILLTSQPIYSHLVPAMVPLAQCARAMGHEVVVATAGDMAGELARHGVAHVPLPHVAGLTELRTDPALAVRFGLPLRPTSPGRRVAGREITHQIARAYAGAIALSFAEDVIEVARDWRPDVIVREPGEYGGYLAAERLGIPHAMLDVSPMAILSAPMVIDALNEQRVVLGLKPVDDPMHPYRYLRAGLIAESWYPLALRLPTGRYYRVPAPRFPESLDPAVAALPTDRPLVLASLGSLALSLPSLADLLPMIAAALGRVPCHAVLTLGSPGDIDHYVGTAPDNVYVTQFVAQRTLLGACDLLLTHGGFGSLREAIEVGVPMVVLPAISDGPANAERVAALGIGRTLDVEQITVDGIVDACVDVLADPQYRRRARAVQLETLANPGFDQLVADLAALVDRQR